MYMDRVVKEYIHLDPKKHQELESSITTSGIIYTRKRIEVQTIDSTGRTYGHTYQLPGVVAMPFKMDAGGQIEIDLKDLKRAKRRKTWRKIGNTVMVVGAFVAGVMVAK